MIIGKKCCLPIPYGRLRRSRSVSWVLPYSREVPLHEMGAGVLDRDDGSDTVTRETNHPRSSPRANEPVP